MILFPAIDLKDGECVRLVHGDMEQSTVFNTDPVAQARAFEALGFEYLHLVDLDGAFAGKPVNAIVVEGILEAVRIPVQLGGGIRDMRTIEGWLGKGVARVIIGTAAVRDPDMVREAARLFPGRIAVGIDARNGYVAIEGWAKASQITATRTRRAVRGCRRRRPHLYGHHARRRPAGPEFRTRRWRSRTRSASRSSHRADWRRSPMSSSLLQPDCARLAGAITGRALYDGRIDAAKALALIRAARDGRRAQA